MKKLFILFAISSLGFVACNNASESEDSTETSDTSVVDPTLGNPPVNPTDTMVNLDTTAATDSAAINL